MILIKIVESSYTDIKEENIIEYADTLEKLLIRLKLPYERINSGSKMGKSVYFESVLWRATPIRISAHSKGAINYARHINIESEEAFSKVLKDISKIKYTPPVANTKHDEQTDKMVKKRIMQGLKDLKNGKDFFSLHKDVQRDITKYKNGEYDF